MTCMNNILFMCVRVIDFDFILMTFDSILELFGGVVCFVVQYIVRLFVE